MAIGFESGPQVTSSEWRAALASRSNLDVWCANIFSRTYSQCTEFRTRINQGSHPTQQ